MYAVFYVQPSPKQGAILERERERDMGRLHQQIHLHTITVTGTEDTGKQY